MLEHKRGADVEPITTPTYTRSMRKRRKAELKDCLDKTLAVGRFALIRISSEDPLYRLELGLVKITGIDGDRIDFNWYTYNGYPENKTPSYSGRWQVQILAGRGQKVDTGSCYVQSVVLTFPALTKKKTIPNVGRTAPLKMITRALSGEFGALSDKDTDSDSEYEGTSEDEAPLAYKGGPCSNTRRAKKRVKL